MATKAIHRHLLQKAKTPTTRTPGGAHLTYYIFEGVLVGYVQQDMVHVIAWSGGAGGSLTKSAPNAAVVNNPYQYGKKTTDTKVKGKKIHVHGGPIPPGSYEIMPPSQHARLGLSSFLRPLHKVTNDRDGFFIHRQGKHGSDGCIVPEEDAFEDLMAKLKASGGGSLHVLQSMDGVFV